MNRYSITLRSPSGTREVFYLKSRPALVDVATVQLLRELAQTYHMWRMVSRRIEP